MPITDVKVRQGSTKREITTLIVEFYLSERDYPYKLYVNTATDANGLKEQLLGLANIILWKPSLFEKLDFFRSEVLGELGWDDEEEASGKDQLDFAREQIRELRKEASRRTPRALDGARFCPSCRALLEEGSVYCDTCGTDTPRR